MIADSRSRPGQSSAVTLLRPNILARTGSSQTPQSERMFYDQSHPGQSSAATLLELQTSWHKPGLFIKQALQTACRVTHVSSINRDASAATQASNGQVVAYEHLIAEPLQNGVHYALDYWRGALQQI